MYKDLIGKRSNAVTNIVEKSAVQKFATAIGDPHRFYLDEEFAQQTEHKKNLVPPTFPIAFDYGFIEGLQLPSSGLIHGEQAFQYKRPLYIGEEFQCYSEVENYFEKTGNTGALGFLTVKNVGKDSHGETVFSLRFVIIITEAVRREMEKHEHYNATRRK